MPHAYTEELLVELPAFDLLGDLGWELVSALPLPEQLPSGREVAIDASGLLGRETPAEVVLLPRLRAALEKLNPHLPPESIEAAIAEIIRDWSAMEPAAANREVYELLKDGIRVSVPDTDPSPRPSPKGRGSDNSASHPGSQSSAPQPSPGLRRSPHPPSGHPLPSDGRGASPAPAAEGQGRGAGQKLERVRVIDWNDPANNDYVAVRQISFIGPLYTCRPDIVCFLNGLPLVVLEFKKPGVPARQAFDDNLTSYKHPQNGVPALFWFNALLIASNGTESRVGSLTADWERFFEWKRIEREDEPRKVSLETVIRGTCDQTRLLDLVENFTLFSELKSGLTKVIGQNHQVLGVNNAVAATLEARGAGHGRGGVFWQTQGSGKSFSMVFYAQKILRKFPGNWTFVIVTDRVELDQQIAKTFAACGAVTDAKECHATSGAHLRQLLGGNHRYVFTLIHKFRPESCSSGRESALTDPVSGREVSRLTSAATSGEVMPVLCDRPDVIVLTDEAHRSQYDTLALNMRAALPKALFFAFTGTPLIAGEERTKEVFGDYVSIYDFQQSVEDKATVPLFYENRTPELELTNPTLNEDIYDIIENAGLDEAHEDRLEQVLGRQYHILTRDDRLETVAEDIVRHFLGRGFKGKAMVVSIDKATALRMHDKVKKHWAVERERVEKEIAVCARYPAAANVSSLKSKARSEPTHAGCYDSEKLQELQRRLELINSTDMALIVSPGQNEVEQMKTLGLDIVPHRKRINDSQPPLDEKFKDPDDPLSLVFVCAMWLTGFDAPSCSTVYLDKPMRNLSLMQAIARANRVFPGKHSGVIVDYANVFASLEKALAIYGAGKGGKTPVRDKKKLVEDLKHTLEEATAFCATKGVVLPAIEQLSTGSMQRLERIADAVDALISPDPLRKEFLGHERIVKTLFDAVKPDLVVLEFAPRVSCIVAIADAIRVRITPDKPDISGVMGEIYKLLDASIEGVNVPGVSATKLDLSKIDFEALARRFKESRRKNIELEQLKAAVRRMLERLIRLNRTRVDFLERFEELIDEYNSGSKNIEQLFEELLQLSRSLTEEQERHVRENVSEEELVIFDILTRPGPELTAVEREQVKKVARHLLERLKSMLVLDWRKRAGSLAQTRLTIEDALDDGLPRAYTPEVYQQKCAAIFEHLFESYQGEGRSIYADAG